MIHKLRGIFFFMKVHPPWGYKKCHSFLEKCNGWIVQKKSLHKICTVIVNILYKIAAGRWLHDKLLDIKHEGLSSIPNTHVTKPDIVMRTWAWKAELSWSFAFAGLIGEFQDSKRLCLKKYWLGLGRLLRGWITFCASMRTGVWIPRTYIIARGVAT